MVLKEFNRVIIVVIFFLSLLLTDTGNRVFAEGCNDGDANTCTDGKSLLNAYAGEPPLLESMAPNKFYFFEFPVDKPPFTQLKPMCADGSPYSFLFRRGTDEHATKLVVEFEGGPACWDSQCGCEKHARRTPWSDYLQNFNLSSDAALPRLDICSGIVSDYVKHIRSSLIGNSTSDMPVSLRDEHDSNNNSQWWKSLDSSIQDWSYILLPHCSMDWHLGRQSTSRLSGCDLKDNGSWREAQETIFHRGGSNVDSVMYWIRNSLLNQNGLEALVTFSGGKIGGCEDQERASSIVPTFFAQKAVTQLNVQPSSVLVVTEGASLMNLPNNNIFWQPWRAHDLTEPYMINQIQLEIQNAPADMHFAWIASSNAIGDTEEKKELDELKQNRPFHFHVYVQPSASQDQTCPNFAFPNDGNDTGRNSFFSNVGSQMAWITRESGEAENYDSLDEGTRSSEEKSVDTEGLNLSYLSVSLLTLGIIVLIYLIYFAVKHYRKKHNLPLPLSPGEIWLKAITVYPCWFLLASLAIPISLSVVAFARSGYTISVNLDFDTYLETSSTLDLVANNYAMAQEFQKELSLKANGDCKALGESVHKRRFLKQKRGFDPLPIPPPLERSRELYQRAPQFSDDTLVYNEIAFIYQNRNGGNVFEPEVLQDIYDFEQTLQHHPDYLTYCRRIFGECISFDSITSELFLEGYLVSNISQVLADNIQNARGDQYLGPDYLQSNVTKAYMYLQGRFGDVNRFMEELYHDILWKLDQEGYYAHMVFTWENLHLLDIEANEALYHDALWSIGSLVVISIMIFLKVQDFFVFFFGILGLLLAFTTSYYWCFVHFGIPDITILHVSGLFVMLGIGADDIFLMIDSYDHARTEAEDSFRVGRDENPCRIDKEDIEKIRERMRWAYSTAGSMMLVSSMTAAFCFFSNAFGVLLVIQEFGIYMGVVVLVNFFHVMTILPSAILVNEIYVKPLKRRAVMGCLRFEMQKPSGINTRIDTEIGTPKELPILQPTPPTVNESIEVLLKDSENQIGDYPCDAKIDDSVMNRIDRWLLGRYTPFLVRRRVFILLASIAFAVLFCLLGVLNLETSDGSIEIFSKQYNQGRLTSIQKDYYGRSTSDFDGNFGFSSGSSSNGGTSDSNLNSSPSAPISDFSPVASPINNGDGGNTGGESPTGSSPGGGGTSNGGSGNGSGGTGDNGDLGNGVGSGGDNGEEGDDDFVSSGSNSTSGDPNSTVTPPFVGGHVSSGADNTQINKRTEKVKLMWGIDPNDDATTNPWFVKKKRNKKKNIEDKTGNELLEGLVPGFDFFDPRTQQWLLDVNLAVRSNKALNVIMGQPTWIEILYEFAMKQDDSFPIANRDFLITYIEILKSKEVDFEELIQDEIGTMLPGLAGESLYASITFETEELASLSSFEEWTSFAASMNQKAPSGMAPMIAQSDLFWNEYRAKETLDSTVNTWLIANGLCFVIILLFTQNIWLCLMIMITIVLMFSCIAGWLFFVFGLPLGPVQALGVAIFIGLSANYSLHVVHAYHRSSSDSRVDKVKHAVFITGSPICASALSTIGGCVFLFGCRTSALIELGILITCVTAMALIYSMAFLLAWLLTMGPLPFSNVDIEGNDSKHHRLHQWDIFALHYIFPFRRSSHNVIAKKSREQQLEDVDSDTAKNREKERKSIKEVEPPVINQGKMQQSTDEAIFLEQRKESPSCSSASDSSPGRPDELD